VTATSKISRKPVQGASVDGPHPPAECFVNDASSLLAGLFNTFPSSVFVENNGNI